jgi:hypothetical protein
VRRHTAIDTLTQKMLISGCQLPLKPILFGMIVTRLFRRQELGRENGEHDRLKHDLASQTHVRINLPSSADDALVEP